MKHLVEIAGELAVNAEHLDEERSTVRSSDLRALIDSVASYEPDGLAILCREALAELEQAELAQGTLIDAVYVVNSAARKALAGVLAAAHVEPGPVESEEATPKEKHTPEGFDIE